MYTHIMKRVHLRTLAWTDAQDTWLSEYKAVQNIKL